MPVVLTEKQLKKTIYETFDTTGDVIQAGQTFVELVKCTAERMPYAFGLCVRYAHLEHLQQTTTFATPLGNVAVYARAPKWASHDWALVCKLMKVVKDDLTWD